MSEKNSSISKEEQLLRIIKKYPDGLNIEIFGVIVEYVGMSKTHDLKGVLTQNSKLAKLFDTSDKSQKTKARSLLKSLLREESDFDALLRLSRVRNFSGLRKMLRELQTPLNIHKHRSLGERAGFEVQAVIWHLSDIHFGDEFWDKQGTPEKLADQMGDIGKKYPDYTPHLIIVSGDLTTRAVDEEFKMFFCFAGKLGKSLWGLESPGRFLIVPGNHDTEWLEGGKTDRLQRFREVFRSMGFLTPFGEENTNLGDEKIRVVRHFCEVTQPGRTAPEDGREKGRWTKLLRRAKELVLGCPTKPKDEEPPPSVAEVFLDDLKLRVILLNSAQYSWDAPQEIAEAITNSEKDADKRKKVIDAIRADPGAFKFEYVHLVKDKIQPRRDYLTIAVTHHHVRQIGPNINLNPQSEQLLSVLEGKGIWLLLHGHTHLFEPANSANPQENKVCAIPCATLSGTPDPSSPAGFCVHLLGEPGEQRKFFTMNWPIAVDGQFDADLLIPRYGFTISRQTIEPLGHPPRTLANDVSRPTNP